MCIVNHKEKYKKFNKNIFNDTLDILLIIMSADYHIANHSGYTLYLEYGSSCKEMKVNQYFK